MIQEYIVKYSDILFKLIILVLLLIITISIKGLSENGRYQQFEEGLVIDTRNGKIYSRFRSDKPIEPKEYRLLVKEVE